MIKLNYFDVTGFEPAIRGMRNPWESWKKSDYIFYEFTDQDGCCYCHDIFGASVELDATETDEWPEDDLYIGPNDLDLMLRLAKSGPEHAKYKRMIVVYVDILAPLYWWKEFDTYKVGTVANSCSTMHCIHKKEFTIEDFSWEHLVGHMGDDSEQPVDNSKWQQVDFANGSSPLGAMIGVIRTLNKARTLYLETKDKKYWWQMIQLLPSSYNQKRTVMLNYEVLTNIYRQRKAHKLDEWRQFCKWIKDLPYSELITLEEGEQG